MIHNLQQLCDILNIRFIIRIQLKLVCVSVSSDHQLTGQRSDVPPLCPPGIFNRPSAPCLKRSEIKENICCQNQNQQINLKNNETEKELMWLKHLK